MTLSCSLDENAFAHLAFLESGRHGGALFPNSLLDFAQHILMLAVL